MGKKIVALLMGVILVLGAAGCDKKSEEIADSSEDKVETVELSMLVDTTNGSSAGFKAVVALAEKELGMEISVETRPGGTEGDNLVKTRLASGDMTDLCVYNSGALLNALNPKEYFMDISGEKFVERLDDSYKSAVSAESAVYGIPFASSQAEAIMYSKPLYKKYNLEVPKTWEEFLKNCDVLKEAGETAILAAFGDAWTAQIPFLGDAYNLINSDSSFPQQFDAGKAKWADTPAALRSFEKLADTSKYYNEDYLATTYDEGCDMMAKGEAGHWFILSKALTNIYSLYGDQVNDLGYFAIPGDNAEDNGITLWLPVAIYGNKNSDNQEAIKKFMEFYISDKALDEYSKAALPDGPFCIKNYQLPKEAYDAVAIDIQGYFDAGKIGPALEYISSVKGAECPAICQELGSGQTTAQEAAEKYDKDCEKQAIQLGLKW